MQETIFYLHKSDVQVLIFLTILSRMKNMINYHVSLAIEMIVFLGTLYNSSCSTFLLSDDKSFLIFIVCQNLSLPGAH